MVHVLRIFALLALVAVSATAAAETVELERHQSDAAVASHAARLLTAEAGSSSGTGGNAAIGSAPAAMGGLSPAQQAIVAQWTAAKGLLERAFTGEPTLLASLNQFQEQVTAALQKDDLTLDDAKTLMSTWLASLETDPAFAKVAAQLAPMKAALGGASATHTGSGSGMGMHMGGMNSSTVGTTAAPMATPANSTAKTPAPTSSASTVAAFGVPVVVAIAGVVASL